MSFETNTDYVSLNVQDASRKDKKRFKMSKLSRKGREGDKKDKVKDRVELRKRAREEYRRLAKFAEMQRERAAAGNKGKQRPQISEQDSSAESSSAATKSKKKRKSKIDIDLLPELLEQASGNPDFHPRSMSIAEMQENLITGSEKRAAKRKLKEDEKEVRLLKKKEKKKRAKRNRQEEQQPEGEAPSFFIDTDGAR
jgi:hypothetical protein